MHFVIRFQRFLLSVGAVLIGVYLAAYFHREILSQVQMRQFHGPPEIALAATKRTLLVRPISKVDFRLWSKKRIAEYEESLARRVDPPLARLHISKVQLEVPV